MVGLGTIFIAVLAIAAFLLWRGRLFESRWMLWILLLSFPRPYITNTAGWMTAELGRQPSLIYGLMRTAAGVTRAFPAATRSSRCSVSWACIRCSPFFFSFSSITKLNAAGTPPFCRARAHAPGACRRRLRRRHGNGLVLPGGCDDRDVCFARRFRPGRGHDSFSSGENS